MSLTGHEIFDRRFTNFSDVSCAYHFSVIVSRKTIFLWPLMLSIKKSFRGPKPMYHQRMMSGHLQLCKIPIESSLILSNSNVVNYLFRYFVCKDCICSSFLTFMVINHSYYKIYFYFIFPNHDINTSLLLRLFRFIDINL